MAETKTDEWGRRIPANFNSPDYSTLFNSRPSDRRKAKFTKWKPEEIARALRDAEDGDMHAQADLFEHMEEADGALSGFMQTRRNAPLGLRWSIIASDESAKAKSVAKYVHEVVTRIRNFRSGLIHMQDAVGKGMSALEIDWNKKKTVDAIRWIHPKRYNYSYNEDIFRVLPDEEVQRHEPVIPPPGKVIIHRTQMRIGHPARAGVLRVLVMYFLFRNYSMTDWSIYSEIFGMPLRIGKYPAGASAPDKAELKAALVELGTDASAIFSEKVAVEFAAAVDRGVQPYEALYDACERQMAFATLGQQLTNTAQPTGIGSGLGSVHQMVRQDLLEFDCEDSQETIRRDLFYWIVRFGIGPAEAEEFTPLFKFHYEPPADYKSMVETDMKLMLPPPQGLGLGEHVTWRSMLERYHFPEAPEGTKEEDFLIPPGWKERQEENAARANEGREADDDERDEVKKARERRRKKLSAAIGIGLRHDRSSDADQDLVDDFAERTIGDAARAMKRLAAPLQVIVAKSSSLEEIEQRISRAFDDLPTDQLEALVGEAVYVARLFGTAVAVRRTE